MQFVSNPFATRFVRPGVLRYRFQDGDHGRCAESPSRLDQLVDRLRHHRVGLLTGHHGSGKSTLLRTLRPRLESHFRAVHHVQLRCSRGNAMARATTRWRIASQLLCQVEKMPGQGLLVIDGAEQVGDWHFRRIARRIQKRELTLLATSHRVMTGGVVLHCTSVNAQLVQQLADELTADASDALRRHVALHLSKRDISPSEDVRELFFELYDIVHDQTLGTTQTCGIRADADAIISKAS